MNTKKCIVLDLDNTLWGGILGEDGFEGIKLSLDESGAGFIAFQQSLLDLHNRGVILVINSSNDFEDAIRVIRNHPNMVLKENNFTALKINWNNKVDNMRELVKEINISLDSIVFFDDDPLNRALVKAILPEVEVPELPVLSSAYAKFLMDLPYFPTKALTDEDSMRGNFYVTERLRQKSEKSFKNQKEFLESLNLELHVFIDDPSSVARLSQLSGKTNQFNTNKKPLTEQEMVNLINHPDYKVFYGRLTDRFGDYGITNLAVIKREGKRWRINQFLMSCRIIGRGVEGAFLSAIGKFAKEKQIKELSIDFNETPKNKPAKDFVENYFKKSITLVDDIIDASEWVKSQYGKV